MLHAHLTTTARIAAFVACVAAAPAAADEAVATTHLNVRTGPGATFDPVDTLFPGEVVEMTECQPNGWCYITHDGPDGWVSAAYLTGTPSAGPLASDCRFELRIGPGGPEFSIVCGGGGGGVAPPADDAPPPAEGGAPVPVGDQACFYDLPNFEGDAFCRGVTTINTLPPAANDRITSVRLGGSARVRLCTDPGLGGFCRNVNASEGQLGGMLNNQVSSLQVFIGAPPAGIPPVLSSGTITLPNTRRVDLDTGSIGMAGHDLWYRVHSPDVPRLAPRNGAQIGTTAGPVTGYASCAGASYSGAALAMSDMSPGVPVCVRTSEGRTAIIRRDGATPVNITLFYRTFDD
jgi:hypothetical protein